MKGTAKTTVCNECGGTFHDDETTRCECGVVLCDDCTCSDCYGDYDSDLDDDDDDDLDDDEDTDSWLDDDEEDDDEDD